MVRLAVGVFLAFVCLALVRGPASARPPKPEKPGVQGSVKWNYTVTDKAGDLVEKGFFWAKNSVIISKGGEQVGTYEDVSPIFVKVNITKGKLEGKLELRRDNAAANEWHGKLVRPDGSKYNIKVGFEKLK
jgi:hypothetical protein